MCQTKMENFRSAFTGSLKIQEFDLKILFGIEMGSRILSVSCIHSHLYLCLCVWGAVLQCGCRAVSILRWVTMARETRLLHLPALFFYPLQPFCPSFCLLSCTTNQAAASLTRCRHHPCGRRRQRRRQRGASVGVFFFSFSWKIWMQGHHAHLT